ncbi:MAG: YceI family protein [Bacteroidales bacterium]|jgi:polyisoprenoid-binding protein YceI|nr:YceI family protein [Bacteroidales bacterium]MDD3736510.1 YceI family protein [Bacteroidales bacterium]HNT93296.1 YceI family protein [Bacteroidales bacterium]HOO65907.1 YceI family protein [Bacteroidales bacterium]HPE21892.1 YceI family protein [Bacteroidales bacterium]
MKTTKWIIDPAHSEIQFKVKHMMITTVTGSFKEFSSEVETEGEDFSTARIRFEAATASIFTNAEQRDAHLRSADFFDADNFPVMSFVSSKLEKTDDDNWQLTGDLTIKDVTKPVKLDVEFGGVGKDPWGNTKAGFSLSGKINRKDWGLNWNAALEAGGVLVSDDVRILCEVQYAIQA